MDIISIFYKKMKKIEWMWLLSLYKKKDFVKLSLLEERFEFKTKTIEHLRFQEEDDPNL